MKTEQKFLSKQLLIDKRSNFNIGGCPKFHKFYLKHLFDLAIFNEIQKQNNFLTRT